MARFSNVKGKQPTLIQEGMCRSKYKRPKFCERAQLRNGLQPVFTWALPAGGVHEPVDLLRKPSFLTSYTPNNETPPGAKRFGRAAPTRSDDLVPSLAAFAEAVRRITQSSPEAQRNSYEISLRAGDLWDEPWQTLPAVRQPRRAARTPSASSRSCGTAETAYGTDAS